MKLRSYCSTAAFILLAACSAKPKPAATESTPSPDAPRLFQAPAAQLERLDVDVITSREIVRPLDLPAAVTFDELKTTDVVPLVGGKVEKILVHEGDHVTAGQPLLQIVSPDSSDNTANLRRDQAAVETKKAVVTRDRDLYAHKAVSLEELQLAELDLKTAEASVEDDEAHVQMTGTGGHFGILKAPIGGTVVRRLVSVGTTVQAGGTVCFTLTDPTLVWVVGQLYQEDLRRAEVGNTARIESPALDTPIEGKVIYIGSMINSDSLTLPVRVAVNNPNGALKSGAYVNLKIYPSKPERAILVPSAALLRDADNLPFVYVEVSHGTFGRRRVDLGDQLGDQQIITAGLKDGERVLGQGAVFIQFADSLEK